MKRDKFIIMLVGIVVLILACSTNPYSPSNEVCSASHSVSGRQYIGHGVSNSKEKARKRALENWVEKCENDETVGCEEAKNNAHIDCDTLENSWED